MVQGSINIEKYKDLALQKQGEHRKFLASLKKKAPKNLDKIVQQIHQEVFQEIDCTAFEDLFLEVDEDGDKVFKAMPCPFLGDDNLCSIYDVRPKACREFPHTDRKKIYQINNLTIKNTLTCPAAYLFVEKLKSRIGK
ncbi:TPA: YkgJ family cysteine cluster protein [Streptococcus agalactiae]|nr:YkgJ family cysteine cluster protein [Streptococcus agalactiae]HEO3994423.1 YkgJ family cysteine cluster protein [Streptococcus agalactiae]HEO4552376.1 YkgJ family cysteine cluster protein [Streptococcus agalactiae]